MEQTKHSFYPPIKTSNTLNSFVITVIELILNKSVSLNVMLYDLDDRIHSARNYLIEGEDYQAWGNDDSYITNWVKAKLQSETSY